MSRKGDGSSGKKDGRGKMGDMIKMGEERREG